MTKHKTLMQADRGMKALKYARMLKEFGQIDTSVDIILSNLGTEGGVEGPHRLICACLFC